MNAGDGCEPVRALTAYPDLGDLVMVCSRVLPAGWVFECLGPVAQLVRAHA
jgi:hypothetical protein